MMTSNNTYEYLKSLGHRPEQDLEARKKFSCAEKGVKYTLKFNDGDEKQCVSFLVDGGIVQNNNTVKCDKLLLIDCSLGTNERWVRVFIELKGSNVVHALKQIEATMSLPEFSHKSNARTWARIVVSNRIPRNGSNRDFEQLKAKLYKRGCNVKLLHSGVADKFDVDLAFR